MSKRVNKIIAIIAVLAVVLSTSLNTYAVTWKGATKITSAATQSSKTYKSTTSNQNALLISTSKAVKIKNPTITKSGSSNGGDNCNFYGTNSAVLCKGGGSTTITGGTVKTTAEGANGIFSYGGNSGRNGTAGNGTTVNINKTKITTSGNSSGGIMTTGGGITNATNLTVKTSGNSSAPIRTDRGGGTVNVNYGTYKATGVGSPAIYSTADVSVSNAKLITTKSEAVVIEGENSVTLVNCKVTGNNATKNGQSTTYDNVKIYQSMSGDAADGTSYFNMYGGKMVCKTGNMFHITNTTAVINLENATLKNSSTNVLLNASADAWGTTGKNGGYVTLNAKNQTLKGIISVDKISKLNLILSSGSTYTGKINTSGTKGSVYVEVPSGCTWTLTGNSYIKGLTCAASAINLNGYMLYVNGKAYTSGTASKGTEITSANPDSFPSTVKLNTATYAYNGKAKKPSITVKTASGTTVSSSNYTLTYAKGRKRVGTYAVKVVFSGSYSGTKMLYFNIRPKKTTISKLTAKSQGFTVRWNKVTAQTTGYQIQYATNSSFTNKKTLTVSKNTTVSKTVSSLTSGKTYYVRVRTYKTVNGKKYYSAWSAVKSVNAK